LYPEGSGSGSGSFTIRSGNVTVDQIRIQMWTDGQTELLAEVKIDVNYQFEAAAAGCAGTVFAGACWYHGAANIPCDAVCASRGGYDGATKSYSGSDGTPANCKNVLDALNIPLDDFFETAQGGIGCFTIQTTSGNYFGYWDSVPTTASGTSGTPGRRRICACNN
jgi:hypothetical protein